VLRVVTDVTDVTDVADVTQHEAGRTRPPSRRSEGLTLLALAVGLFVVVAALRFGVQAVTGGEPLARASTEDATISVTSLTPTGVDARRVAIAVTIENTGDDALVVDASWFRMMRGTAMAPVFDADAVPATTIEPGDSADFEPEFLAPPAGETPRVEVADPDGAVATLALDALQRDAGSAEAPEDHDTGGHDG
jgi:hypothetical protein